MFIESFKLNLAFAICTLLFCVNSSPYISSSEENLEEKTCDIISPKVTNSGLVDNDIRKASWPWLVALYAKQNYKFRLICCATLISERVVLTAGRCLTNHKKEDFLLVMGQYNQENLNKSGSAQYEAHSTVVHPDYRGLSTSLDADIGFIITDRNVEYSENIRPACISRGLGTIDELAGQFGKLVGWSETSLLPEVFRGKIATDSECVNSNSDIETITTRRNFCAGNRDGSGPCSGENGSGFFVLQNGHWVLRGVLVGVLLNRRGECDFSNFAIYTDVDKFKSWIESESQSVIK